MTSKIVGHNGETPKPVVTCCRMPWTAKETEDSPYQSSKKVYQNKFAILNNSMKCKHSNTHDADDHGCHALTVQMTVAC